LFDVVNEENNHKVWEIYFITLGLPLYSILPEPATFESNSSVAYTRAFPDPLIVALVFSVIKS